MMKKRPTSITVIAWVLIVGGLLNLLGTLSSMNNPKSLEMFNRLSLSIPFQYFMIFSSICISLVTGVGALKGWNWARYFYFFGSLSILIYSLFVFPIKVFIIPGLIFYGVTVFFLFNKPANYFFQPDSRNTSENFIIEQPISEQAGDGISKTRRVLSVIFYVISGFFVYTVSLMSFFNYRKLEIDEVEPYVKFWVMGIFTVPLLIFLIAGAAVKHFKKWKSGVGIVCLSGASFTFFIIITFYLSFSALDEDLNFFTDYTTGIITTSIFAGLGAVFIRLQRAENKLSQHPKEY